MRCAVIVIALVSGCLEDQDDGSITVTWHLSSFTGDSVACPTGFGSAELVANPDKVFTTCVASSIGYSYGTGAVPDAYVEIVSDDHSTPLARSPSIREDPGFLAFGDTTWKAEILVDGGYFQFSWQLARADQFQGACGDDGIIDIAIETRLVDDASGTEMRFPCRDNYGRAALAPGRYLVTISARDGQNQIVGTPRELGEQLILDPSKLKPVNDLRQITIAIP